MRTTTVKKKFSHIDGVSGFSDWERAVRLINYMRGTFIENKLKIVTTTVAEIRETEKLIFLQRITTEKIQELSISCKEWNAEKQKEKFSI